MFNGYGSQGAVIAQILADCNGHDMRQATRYDPRQIIEKVWYRRESVASHGDDVPSYVWWTLKLDEDACPVPDVDYGLLPNGVRMGRKDRSRGVNDYRHSWPRAESEHLGDWHVVLGISDLRRGSDFHGDPWDYVLQRGMAVGQHFLTRCSGHYERTSYEYDEWDVVWDAEVIYADEAPNHLLVPVEMPWRQGDMAKPLYSWHGEARRKVSITTSDGAVIHEDSGKRPSSTFIPSGMPRWFR